jgi:hypothetical protein
VSLTSLILETAIVANSTEELARTSTLAVQSDIEPVTLKAVTKVVRAPINPSEDLTSTGTTLSSQNISPSDHIATTDHKLALLTPPFTPTEQQFTPAVNTAMSLSTPPGSPLLPAQNLDVGTTVLATIPSARYVGSAPSPYTPLSLSLEEEQQQRFNAIQAQKASFQKDVGAENTEIEEEKRTLHDEKIIKISKDDDTKLLERGDRGYLKGTGLVPRQSVCDPLESYMVCHSNVSQ